MTSDLSYKKIILVVEDDQCVRESLAELLELEGYKVLTAPDGDLGLELLWEHSPSLVILDLDLPKIDGIEFKKIMDSNVGRKKTPVLVFTAQPANIPGSMGFAEVLTKAAPFEHVIAVVRRYIGS